MYIIKGKHAVLEALKTGQSVDSLRVATSAQNHPDIKIIMQILFYLEKRHIIMLVVLRMGQVY